MPTPAFDPVPGWVGTTHWKQALTTPNPYLKDFTAQLRDRFAIESRDMSMTDWVCKNTTLLKKPFSLEGYEFQRAILDDMHPNLCCIKVSQVGLTEVQLRKFAGFLTRNKGTSAIFTLPTDEMYRRVSQTRFSPMLTNDRVFNMASSNPIRRVDLFQIDQSFGYFVGNKESDATSIAADMLLHDELDLSDSEMIALFQSRLQGSNYRITQTFSTPTYEGIAVDAMFKASDQHEYTIRCECCGHHNLPQWTPGHIHFEGLSSDIESFFDVSDEMAERIDYGKSYVFCSKCHKSLNLSDPSLREWVPRFPGRRNRGYRVTPFTTDRLGIQYIMEQQLLFLKQDARRRFHNTVLGEAHNDDNARLSETDIRSIMEGPARPDISPRTPVVVGIDVGLTCHLVLIALTHPTPLVFYWAQIPEHNLADDVERLRDSYNIVGGVIDRFPYTPLSNQIRDESKNLILPCEYAGGTSGMRLVKDELDALSHVRGPRTEIIDYLVNQIKKRKVAFSGYGQMDHLIIEQLRNMVRVEKSSEVAVWEKIGDNDHFFHALGYGLFAIRVHNLMLTMDSPQSLLMTSLVTNTPQIGTNLGLIRKGKQPIFS